MNSSLPQLTLVKEIDADSFIAPSGDPAYGYWLRSTTDASLDAAVRAIRSDPRYALVPIFSKQAGSPQTQALVDGCFGTIQAVSEAAQSLHERSNALGIDIFDLCGQNDRLFGYLLTRPDKRIEPISDWRHESAYRYPLLECLADDGQCTEAWLKQIKALKLINEVELVDRTRHCTQCESSHLNYLDICPNCHEIDINRQKFIHCFSCGNIGQDEDYMRAGVMQCNVCKQMLKHIGTDYDRPLESYACRACKSRFEEPLVVAKCLICSQADTPDKLMIRQIERYELSEKGRMKALYGRSEECSVYSDKSEHMLEFDVFQQFLSWHIATLRRSPSHTFTLITTRIVNRAMLLQSLGAPATDRLMKHFFRLVGEMIRDTDIASYDANCTIWLLLSPTDTQSPTHTLEQIKALCEKTLNDDHVGIELQTKVVNAPEDLNSWDDVDSLLGWDHE